MLLKKVKFTRFVAVVTAAVMLITSLTLPAAAAKDQSQATASVIKTQPDIIRTTSASGIVHPSAGLNADSLELMQEKIAIGAEPWLSAFDNFRRTPSASLDYDVRNKSKVDPTQPAYTKIDNDAKAKEAKVDAAAAFSHAVMWTATGDERYRAKAMEVIRLWSQIDPTNPVGFYDSHISMGDAMQNMVRAAELLRYTNSDEESVWNWTDQDTTRFIDNFLMAFNEGSFYRSNSRWMNQHGINTSAFMMAAIFSDNMDWYKEAVEWATTNKTAEFRGKSGDIFNQIRFMTVDEKTGEPVEPHVQLIEIGRDIGHASINVDLLAQIAFMTKVQGTKVDSDPASATFGEVTDQAGGKDLFEFLDDRILAGANYLAEYDLGYEVPFTRANTNSGVIGEALDTNYFTTVSDNGRGLNTAGEYVYGYYLHHKETKLNGTEDKIKFLNELITKSGGLGASTGYVLMYGTADLATGVVKGAPQPLEQPTYAETKAAYDRQQAYDFLGRSSSISTNTYQDVDGMRSVLYDVRYADNFTWYDLDVEESFNTITMRTASNSSVGTKIDVVLLDNVAGIDRTKVTLDNVKAGKLLATLQAPNTGWWTNYATISGKLSEPLSQGKHLIAFKYYGSANALSYQIAFDWFALSNHFAGVENEAARADVLANGASVTQEGVEMTNGASISFNRMNFDSGNNNAEFNVKTTDATGKISMYSGVNKIATYSLLHTQGSFLKVTAEIPTEDIGKITGIQDITLKYEGTSPIVLKTYKNVERDRLVAVETGNKAIQIEDQAIPMRGDFTLGTEGEHVYVKVSHGSVLYLSKGALQTDRTKDSYVAFMVKSDAVSKLLLQRTSVSVPFATMTVPNTHGEWAKVSFNIAQQYVNVLDYPTNLRSVFLAIESPSADAEVLLDSYELDPGNLPPSISLTSEANMTLNAVTLMANGEAVNVHVAVQDGDSVHVDLFHDGINFVETNFDGKNGGVATIDPSGVTPGLYTLVITAKDDSGNYTVKSLKVEVLDSSSYIDNLIKQSGTEERLVDLYLEHKEVYDQLVTAQALAKSAPSAASIGQLKEAISLVINTLPSYTKIRVNYSTNGTANVTANSDMLSFYLDGTATNAGTKIGGTGAISSTNWNTYTNSDWIPLNQPISGKHTLKLVWAYPANVRSIELSNTDESHKIKYDALSASDLSSTLKYQPAITNGVEGYTISDTAALSWAVYSGLQLDPQLVYTAYPYKGVFGDGVDFSIRPEMIKALEAAKPYVDQKEKNAGKKLNHLIELYKEALEMTKAPNYSSGGVVLTSEVAASFTTSLLNALAEVKAGAEPARKGYSLSPVNDFYVRAGGSNGNMTFKETELVVGGGREGMVKFDLSHLDANSRIVGATLRLYKTYGPNSVILFSSIADHWGDTTTYNNKPETGAEFARFNSNGLGFYYVDMTQAASDAKESDGIFSFHMNRSAAQNANQYGASRYDNPNYRIALIVTTETLAVLDKESLITLVGTAKATSSESYTAVSVAALQTAIAAAESALANSLTQQQLDAAQASLQAAMEGLQVKNTVVLNGPTSAFAGQTIEWSVSLEAVELPSDYKTIKAVVKYDPAKIEFASIVDDNGTPDNSEDDIVMLDEQAYALNSTKQSLIGSAIKPETGEILLLLTNNEEWSDGELLKLKGRILANAEPGAATVSITEFTSAGTDNEAAFHVEQAVHGIAVGVDKTALNALIATATQFHAQAVAGSQPGQYPQSAKNSLQAAIEAAQAVNENAAANQVAITAAISVLQSAVQTFQNAVTPYPPIEPVNKAALQNAITSAENRYSKTVEGNKVGQYPQAARGAFNSVIAAAKNVLSSGSTTQAQVNQAVTDLNHALQTFNSTIVSLVNGATSISIRDLSIIAKYFGVKQGDAGWSDIEKADLTGENEINIVTLAAVARLIIADWLAVE
ncbi:carbohydrate-binding protein [Paenibacillus paridis]|uniref:carbohydrate-binding protein n=1 Tax=Paenibacillus paridis TaxID=2583376 RepID=UPI00112466AB|nr:carbohydrate-binding protein [Paenibacillus paridis]